MAEPTGAVAQAASDAVSVASQLGRLDFISALLAIVALILAASAVPLFFYLRFRAGEAAREEVTERMDAIEARLEAEAISKLEATLPILVEQYMELIRNAVPAGEANDIAQAQDDQAK
jgi:hypothetical protein